jgi:hypothetical protein
MQLLLEIKVGLLIPLVEVLNSTTYSQQVVLRQVSDFSTGEGVSHMDYTDSR